MNDKLDKVSDSLRRVADGVDALERRCADTNEGKWEIDPKSGKELMFSTPFQNKEDAIKFAEKNGLSKGYVYSRPGGFVVQKVKGR